MFRKAIKLYTNESPEIISAIPLSRWYPAISSIFAQLSWAVLDFEETPFTLFRSDAKEYDKLIECGYPRDDHILSWLVVYNKSAMDDKHISLWEGSWSKHFGITERTRNLLINHITETRGLTARTIKKWLFRHADVFIANVDARYWLLSCDDIDFICSLLRESTRLELAIIDMHDNPLSGFAG